MSDPAGPELFPIPYDAFVAQAQALADAVQASGWMPDFIIGIGRGGLVPGVYISHRLSRPLLSVDHSSGVAGFADDLLRTLAERSAAGERLLFVDDINDSGGTIAYLRRALDGHGAQSAAIRFAVLLNNVRSRQAVDFQAERIDRDSDKRWFIFPWESLAPAGAIAAEAGAVPERLA